MVAASHLVNTYAEETARAIKSTSGVATTESCTQWVLNDSPIMSYKWQMAVTALLTLLEAGDQSRWSGLYACVSVQCKNSLSG